MSHITAALFSFIALLIGNEAGVQNIGCYSAPASLGTFHDGRLIGNTASFSNGWYGSCYQAAIAQGFDRFAISKYPWGTRMCVGLADDFELGTRDYTNCEQFGYEGKPSQNGIMYMAAYEIKNNWAVYVHDGHISETYVNDIIDLFDISTCDFTVDLGPLGTIGEDNCAADMFVRLTMSNDNGDSDNAETSVKDDTENPVWNEMKNFDSYPGTSYTTLTMTALDWDVITLTGEDHDLISYGQRDVDRHCGWTYGAQGNGYITGEFTFGIFNPIPAWENDACANVMVEMGKLSPEAYYDTIENGPDSGLGSDHPVYLLMAQLDNFEWINNNLEI